MYKKLKYSLIIIAICLFVPLYRSEGAEANKSKKEINLTIGKKINGLMENGMTGTYIIKPTQVGKLTIKITSFASEYTSAYFYSEEYSDNKLYNKPTYEEDLGLSVIEFDVYVNTKKYYMYLENGVIDSGEFTISTKFTPINAINSDKRNDSIDSSIPIYNNKYYMGIITNDEAENYYKIKFKKETKFSLKIISKEQSTIDITISDADGNTVYNDWCYYNTKSFSFNDYLPAGEYNIIIKKSQSSFNDYRRYEMVTGSYVAFKSITIPSSRTMKTGDTYIFKAKTKPADATGDYIFISSNDKVVKVHKTTGKITAVGSGTATITVMTTDGDLNDKCKITVKKTPQVSKITLKETKATLFVGESKNMSVKISPKDATNVTVKWKSSNKKVATVSASGKVTAKASGSCKITATAGGKSVTANITVKKKPTKSKTTQKATPTPKPTTIPVKTEVISISMQSTLRVGIDESKALTVTIIPGNAHDMSLTWSSTDASVASVEDGTIKGKKAGKTTIIASASNGKKAYCTVLVGD